MRYTEFRLVEGYKEVTQKFAQEADPEAVKQMIAKYRDLVNRNQVQGNERNIDWWGKQGWDRFSRFVDAKSQQQSQTQQKRRKNVGRSHNLAENDKWLIVIPLDKDASCFHGKGTSWCTTKPQNDYFHHYFIKKQVTLIYFLQKQTGKKWAIGAKENGDHDYFDINDNLLEPEQFSSQTGINPEKYINMAIGSGTDASKKVKKSRSEIKAQVDKMFQLLDQFTKGPSGVRDPELENYIAKYGRQEHPQSNDYAKEIYFVHLLKKPVELDARMQKVFSSMWEDAVEDDAFFENEEELIKNVTNLSDKNKLTILFSRESSADANDLFGKDIPDEIQEKLLDNDISLYVLETDIPLKDRHTNRLLQTVLTQPFMPSLEARNKEFTKQLLNRADNDKIVDNLQDAVKRVLDNMKDLFVDVQSMKAFEYFSYTLDSLKKIAEQIDYDPEPILGWAVQTYDIDYF